MIDTIFYGDVGHYGDGTSPLGTTVDSIVVSEHENVLTLSTLDVASISSSPEAHLTNTTKLDILFYNRVNERGRVLSSIVYLSEVRLAADVASILYRPRYLYKNSSVELGMSLGSVTDFSFFNYLRFDNEVSPYFAPREIEALPIAGDPSPLIMDKYVLLDGWYTLVSAGIYTQPDLATAEIVQLSKGGLCTLNSDTSDIARIALVDQPISNNSAHWRKYDEFSTTLGIDATNGALLGVYLDESRPAGPNSSWSPTYARQDFFIMANFKEVYKTLLNKYLAVNNTYSSGYEQFKYKYRPIKALAKEGNFKEAQRFLQSTEFARLEYTEL